MKQILQYLWISKWQCIDNQNINFSEEYSIKYDASLQTLTITKNDNCYSNCFWGNNIDVTAIVGENGTGKTTVLKTLLATSYLNSISFGFISVYKTETELKIYYYKTPIKKVDTNVKYSSSEIGDKISNRIPEGLSSNGRYIYYTNLLNRTIYSYDSMSYVSDLSTYSMMKKNGKNGVDRFLIKEFSSQIIFFLFNKEVVTDFGITFPKYVTVYFNNNKTGLEELIRRVYKDEKLTDVLVREKFNKCINSFFGIYDNETITDPRLHFEINISCSILLSIILRVIKMGISDIECKELFERLIDIPSDMKPLDKIKLFMSFIECFPVKKYEEFIFYIKKEIIPNSDFSLFNLQLLRFTMSIDFNKNNDVNVNVNASLYEFVMKYEATVNEEDYLSFEWGLSSGEVQLLSTFARIYNEEEIIRRANNYTVPDNVLILLDEVEVSFHPEWQRKYLKCMLNFLSNLYSESHIQIVIATHSPIILSDIPRQNIIFLKKDKRGKMIVDSNDNHTETFGANIFSLYNDSFFLDKGAIGAFAKEKLERLLEEILSRTGEKKDIQNRIHMIGDNFLKRKYQDLFNSKYTITLDEEIERLEEELKRKKELRKINRL